MTEHVRVGVQAIVRSGDRVLLGLRANTFGHGTWGLPGGHLELGESLTGAATRELEEETGARALASHVVCVTDPDPEANHHMQIGVEVTDYTGDISVREPEKCERWQFWPLDDLPESLFVGSAPVLRRIRNGERLPS
ncbi:nucleotide triphosphate diphosphatase NUDT15 [Streptomyces fulvoviolaceus]|uniref:nucleotide triphosphate diphosphatase NUDT15 n=1 Tax=Streptomyces fulvoviolaceus TaxID=285535 RepID=UPI0021BE8D8D|nr:NUDIX domain-containing protein [Streptomyces fulvoviolaceus]MCT9080678.1 NUDIX domain-containing protein [Streptomyces fulvoviolaceus]